MLHVLALLSAASADVTPESRHMHGFRVGYAYTRDDRVFASPHLMVMGYEVSQRVAGGGGLDVLMVGNFSVSGLNQSKAIPTLNLLIGAQLGDGLELGVGPSISWTMPAEEALHMVAAVGWTVAAGDLDVPLHLAWIPDVNQRDRLIATTGVTF